MPRFLFLKKNKLGQVKDFIKLTKEYKKEILEDHLKGQELNFITNQNYDKTNIDENIFTNEKKFKVKMTQSSPRPFDLRLSSYLM